MAPPEVRKPATAATSPTIDAGALRREAAAPSASDPLRGVDPSAATESFPAPGEGSDPDRGADEAWLAWQAMNAAEAALSLSSEDSLAGGAPLVRKVAQFVLLERLGVGGMGMVFAAFDEKLERKVAIKLVTAQGALAQERLLREAQAQARLSHPNVVTVYEVGTLPDGRLFIAMELVKGQTLRSWQQERRRSWREVLAMYTQAGRGLAAAHRGGIVHRDFKPDNILLDSDERVRVADFGLAFAAGEAPAAGGAQSQAELEEVLAGRPSGAARALTAAGALAGTPGYIAPEQFRDAAVDGRTDQFSFCVSLFEALYGGRPYADMAFVAEDEPELRRNGPDPAHPRWLWEALLRGLSLDPNQRFPTMDALLGELTRKRDRTRLWLASGVAAVLAGSGALAYVGVGDSGPPRCAPATSELAGVWDPAVKQRLAAAVAAVPEAYAGKVWQSTERAFDDYAQRWLAGHTAACEATHVRHVQSPELLDLRMECLAGRKRAWSAAVEVLASRPAQALAHAGEMLESLGELAQCADTGALLEQGRRLGTVGDKAPAPAELALRAQVRRDLATVTAFVISGEVVAAEAALQRAQQTAAASSDLALAAELRYAEGRVKLARSEVAQSIEHLTTAAELAVSSRHDELVADIWLTLALDAGLLEQRPAEISHWLGQGEAWVRRLGRSSDTRSISAAHARGALLVTLGKPDRAFEALTAALAAAEALWGKDSARLVAILRDRARALAQLRRAKEAVADAERALELGLAAWGPAYPDISRTRRALGLLYVEQLGDLDRGQRELELALAADQARVGEASIEVASGTQILSQIALYRGDFKAALAHAERAEQLWSRVLGKDHPRRAEALIGVGVVRYMLRDYAGSLEAYRAAYPLQVSALGEGHSHVAVLLSNLGETELALGNTTSAISHFAQALASLEKHLGREHVDLALPLKGLGLAHLLAGRPREAAQPLERALALRLSSPSASSPPELAELRWALARAFAPTELAKAISHAEKALELYRALGADSAPKVAEISAWLRRLRR